jgi:pyruvate dehydrogenase E2 component (dihydrolipoamide acetyltransferase)
VTDFKVPELGENVTSGDVTRVLVKVGDIIARDQPILELETDKATIEVPSSVAGVVKEIKVKPGDKVTVGAVVLTVDEPSGDGARRAAAEAGAPERSALAPAPEPATALETPLPSARREPATAAPAAAERAAEKPPAKPDAKVLSMPAREAAPTAAAPRGEREPVAPASPAVRRLAREIGVDVNQVPGTGPGGRISQDDVKAYARRILAGFGGAGAAAAVRPRPLPDFEKWGAVERQPWSNIRRSTSEHLTHAWHAIPHVTQFDKADVTALEELRQKYKDQVAQAGGALTVTAILVRVLAAAVTQFPQFNASLDLERGEIVYKKYVNVGVAVDTDRGLLVPVVRNADQKNIQQLAIEIAQLAQKARDRRLTLEEMSGGGITISNLGGFGGTAFTPIVNWPEVAILGVSRAVVEPVWRNGAFEPRRMLPLSLSYDHRVIDGADAMRFLRWVVEAIEQPFLLSLVG